VSQHRTQPRSAPPRSTRAARAVVTGAVTLSALAVSAVTGAASAGAAPAIAPVIAPGADTAGGPLVQIAGNVLPGLSQLTSTAPDPSTPMSVNVALAHPDPAGEDAALAAIEDSASPSFRHFITPSAYAARFGVPAARTADVVAGLTAAGLSVGTVSAAGDFVSATGTVAQVQRAFGVTERQYSIKGTTFVANTAGPLVPSLDGVSTVVGLNTLQHYVPQHTSALPSQGRCVAGECTGLTTPQDLWSVYHQPDAYKGAGGRIAIIGEGDTTAVLADLRGDEKAYGLPTAPVTVSCVQSHVTTGVCSASTDGTGEWEIDTQASLGMAPDASEELYFANSIYDGDLNNAFLGWAQDAAGPLVASASLGECEASPGNGLFTGILAPTNGNLGPTPGGAGQAFGNGEELIIDPMLKMAAMAGKTLFASTGDTGSSCPAVLLPVVGGGNGVANQGVPEQNYPAVSTAAVGVGGTVLYTADNGEGVGTTYVPGKPGATRSQEYGWTFSGGGASLYIPEPAFQQAVPAIVQPCVVSVDGSTAATGQTCRGLPDLSAQSGDVATNGYSIVTGVSAAGVNSFGQGAGTSLSSPLVAGMWTRVQAASGNHLGFANPLLYAVGTKPASAARDYTDVTVGGNGLHVATTGWDYATGFGTPDVDGLLCDIDGIASGRYAGTTGLCSALLLPAATPTASLPEVPYPALLLVLAGGGAVTVLARRRRRA